ncbi:MAG: ScyD/ScyE family protein [Acidimicrobiales bacterium]|nr:ScyD/ScyE family protein [Acidimicrobiales bacterium]
MNRLAISLLAILAGLAMAAGVTPAAANSDHEPSWEVLADNLDNPRGLYQDGRNRIYVAEAGRGGPSLVDTPLGDSDGPICLGDTGRISRITNQGVETVIDGLPSATEAVDGACEGPFFGTGATGPHGVDRWRGRLSYSTGLGGTPAVRDVLAAVSPGAANLAMVDIGDRGPQSFDLAQIEDQLDPDGEGADSNPYGVFNSGSNTTVAIDSGGNSLLELRRNGDVEVLATFAPRCVPFNLGENPIPAEFNPCGDQALFPAQAVPTDVARHRDRDLLVSTLGGFPFTPGYSVVYKIDRRHVGTATCSQFEEIPSDGCEVFADGLTAAVGLDVGRRGDVYVVQFADAGVLAAFSGTDAGSVQVFNRNGGHIGSLDGLTLPGGIATRGKHLVVSNKSVFAGVGEVLRTNQLR